MSVSHLRPRSITEIIDAAVQLARRHYRPLLVLSVIVAIPGLAVALLSSHLLPDARTPTELNWGTLLIFPLTLAALGWFFVGFGALVASAAAAYTTGQPMEPAAALRHAFAHAGSLIGANLLAYVRAMGAFLLAGIVAAVLIPLAAASPGAVLVVFLLLLATFVWAIVLFARYINVTPVVVLEGLGPVKAVRRSVALAHGATRRIIGVLLLTFLVFFVFFIVGLSVLGAVLGNVELASALTNFLTIPFYPVMATLFTLLYYDLRIRKEGFDIEVMAEALGGPQATTASY